MLVFSAKTKIAFKGQKSLRNCVVKSHCKAILRKFREIIPKLTHQKTHIKPPQAKFYD